MEPAFLTLKRGGNQHGVSRAVVDWGLYFPTHAAMKLRHELGHPAAVIVQNVKPL